LVIQVREDERSWRGSMAIRLSYYSRKVQRAGGGGKEQYIGGGRVVRRHQIANVVGGI
jgi:hypothetical protein